MSRGWLTRSASLPTMLNMTMTGRPHTHSQVTERFELSVAVQTPDNLQCLVQAQLFVSLMSTVEPDVVMLVCTVGMSVARSCIMILMPVLVCECQHKYLCFFFLIFKFKLSRIQPVTTVKTYIISDSLSYHGIYILPLQMSLSLSQSRRLCYGMKVQGR